MLIDIGANLTHESFADDLKEVIDRAHQATVESLIITGASIDSSVDALQLARSQDHLFSTVGIHPHHAAECSEQVLEQLKSLAEDSKVRAIGETGLDYFRDFCPRDRQRDAFEAQLQLAIEMNLPLFLHERDAFKDFAPILRSYRDKLDSVVVHCFTGDRTALQTYLDMDCYIGITGWVCDERRGQHLHDLIELIPADRLLLETDAPYLIPRSLKEKPKNRRCEPAHLPEICRFVAMLLNTSFEQLANQTSRNARTCFNLP
ncbi:MAG: YchF/TatD family DNA exonuclease [Gammaproteobacteria bacterium]|jgi:TatD DNase family protein|nr:YchF/TatD family DNA exonuclease [Gammaproteobacteria bacterium]MBT5204344.1 YchF/TatD family DNA exonuclease [Gammaproteobacteria bacterium]MBT5603322.1 YchF/TatD family DNA exonuclease [Gammaproteobacteria bacterium]MBT6245479.1 YchF/TatD family DNA exonuclease [Gammaproteobacteria bacterium]